MHTISFTTRKYSYFLSLIGTIKIKLGNKATCIYRLSTNHHGFISTRNHFIHGFIRHKVIMTLIHISYLHRFTNCNRSAIGSFSTHNHSEQSRFSNTIRPNDSNDSRLRQREIQILDEQTITKSFIQIFCFDHLRS